MKKLTLTKKLSTRDLTELVNLIINFESKKNNLEVDLNIVTIKEIILKHFLRKLVLNDDNKSLNDKLLIYSNKRGAFQLEKTKDHIGIVKIHINNIKKDTLLKNPNNNLFRIWCTCAHEIRHAYQHKNFNVKNKKIIDLHSYQNTIEHILRKNADYNFYSQYYDYLFFEKDAVYYGYKEARKYIGGFDEDYVRAYETINDIYTTSLPDQYMLKKELDNYVYNNIKPSLNTNDEILNADLLSLEYNIKGSSIYRKSIYELFNTLNYKDFNDRKPNVTKKLLYQLIWDNIIITKPSNDEIDSLTNEQKRIVLDVLELKNQQLNMNINYSFELIDLANKFDFFADNERNITFRKNTIDIAKNNLEINKLPNSEFRELINHYKKVILNSETKVRNV